MIKSTIFIVCFFLHFFTLSQSIEIELKNEHTFHEVVPADKHGFLLISKLEKDSRSKENKWEVSQYTTEFTRGWSRSYKVNNKYVFARQDYDAGNLYVLFTRYAKKSYILFKINTATGEYTTKTFKAFAKIEITRFRVFNDNVYLGGLVNNNLTLLHYSIANSRLVTLETINSNEGFIESIDAQKGGEEVNVVMVNRQRKRSFLVVKNYSLEGKQKNEVKIDLGDDRNLLTGNINKVNKEEYWLTGTFASKEEFSSKGVFVAGINKEGLQWIRFYAFNNLEKFFSYITPEDKQEFIRKFIRKKEADNTSFDYRIVPHDIWYKGTNVYLAAEACFPKYRTVTHTYFDAMGLPQTTYYEVFDGWKYTHTQIMSFDKSGRMNWNESFPIEQVKTPVVRKTINVHGVEHTPTIAYLYEQKVQSAKIKDQEIVISEGKDVSMHDFRDGLSSDKPTDLRYWYDGNYLIWGVRIKEEVTGKEVKVFYCDKIVFSNNGNKY